MESKKKIAIIGGGYSGLASGILAQLEGYQTKIFEHNFCCGGLAAAFKRGEYKFDDGTHYIMGSREGERGAYELYNKLGIGDPNLYTPMKSFTTFIDEKENIKITVEDDLEKVRKTLLEKAPNEEKIINEFFDIFKNYAENYPLEAFAAKAPDSMGMFDKLKFYYAIRKLLFYMIGEKTKSSDEYCKQIKTPWLSDFFRYVYNEDSAMYMTYIILGAFYNKQVSFINGSCDIIINKMVEKYKSLGGEIQCKATVSKILVENNKAVGIKLENGDEFKSDYVISSGDLTNTLYNLLDGKYLSEELEKRCKIRPMKPIFFATYGVNKEFKDVPNYSTIILKNPIKYGEHEIKKINVRFCTYAKFSPEGKTVVQGLYKAECGYWEELHKKDAELYKKEKERVAEEILERMEQHFPGIKENIEKKDIGTPYTTIRYTMQKNGTYGGPLVSDEIIKNKAKQKVPGLENCYLVGHWVYSCGVLPVILSARNCIELIKENEN